MEKIIVKNGCNFDDFGKVLDKEFLVNGAKKYFANKGVELVFENEISEDRYIEIMYMGGMSREDKNYLLRVFQRGFGKKVAFIKSEPMFFALVDDFMPAVVWKGLT